jgi:hypothetical protein
VDSLQVTWPNGQVQHVPVTRVDTMLTIIQPAAQ